MPASISDKRDAFRRLHQDGCFVLPNPWDVGSAKVLQHLGFKALATTSAGMAWAMGRADGAVSLDEVLLHLSSLAHATDLPLNADFENAFADAPEAVARNVALAVDTGVSGLSVEDYTGDSAQGLYEFDLAVARVAAARAAIDRTQSGVVLTARSEGFIRGAPDLEETIRRLKAFAAAGADCLYAPGIREEAQVRAVVQAAAPKPVNLLFAGLPVATAAEWGVRRISLGGALASVAYNHFLAAATEIAEQGTFDKVAQAPRGQLTAIFGGT
ncbi:MAG TPA: isocitrate lyase/phosphoenolpyruvate mutase family protein [Caulobacteraceae bacterium]|jgi:methylisocitrate lyase|nr:isocitrate lyase/phosphoenolpyruvate mutase family protein [Caulobacteraceae bacterium]